MSSLFFWDCVLTWRAEGGGRWVQEVERGVRGRNSKRKVSLKRRKTNDFNMKKTNVVIIQK
jgi:hypothetical protein